MSIKVLYIFSLGVVSMPLYTFYTISNKWTFGAVACDLYLSVDYMASNARCGHKLSSYFFSPCLSELIIEADQ